MNHTGIIYSTPLDIYGYCAWPSITCHKGIIYVIASGYRETHYQPHGKVVLFRGVYKDNRIIWTPPQVIVDSLGDNRDPSICSHPTKGLIITWAEDGRPEVYEKNEILNKSIPKVSHSIAYVDPSSGGIIKQASLPGVSIHEPIILSTGEIFLLGTGEGAVTLALLIDPETLEHVVVGKIPDPENDISFYEPHCVELDNGTLYAVLRAQAKDYMQGGSKKLRIFKSFSHDGGRNWTEPEYMLDGGPPHLFRHSSGKIILTYGYREKPCGIKALVDGKEFYLHEGAPDTDMGYPASTDPASNELSDDKVVTVWYQKLYTKDEKCSLLYKIWDI